MHRKLLFTFFILVLQTNILFSQSCKNTAANQTLDLRQVLHPQVSIVTRSYKAESSSKAIGDVKYAEDICNFPVNKCDFSDDALMYNVYYPADINYKTCSLPAIFLFHGGGFLECAGSEADQMNTLALEFAKRGFVTFNVEYRRGVLLSLDFSFYTAQQILATYRAAQDARGAIRSAIKRQREIKTNNEPYSIDTNKIFIGGMSAGSVAAMSVAYYQQQQMFDNTIPGMRDALGNVNADYYSGDLTINFKIAGLMNLWGGNIVPNKDSANPANFFKTNAYMPPMIAFAGEQDSTFNYQQQPLNFVDENARFPLTQTPLGYEDRCTLNGTTYQVHSSYPEPSGMIIGSKKMYNALKKMHVAAELYIDTKMQHGLSIQSNNDEKYFGLSTSDFDSTLSYIAQRSAIFFQAVMNQYVNKLGTSVFEDCENYRYASDVKNNNACKAKTIASPPAAAVGKISFAASESTLKTMTVTLYPNPVKDVLQVQLDNAPPAAILDLLDTDGKVLIHKQISSANGYINQISMPVGNFARGLYYLKIATEKGIILKKWVKE